MSKRTERRAAERLAHKAHATNPFTTATAAAPAIDPINLEPEILTETTSQAQINANRENAKLSTGPTTMAGKLTVSHNRRTHGLTGRVLLLEGDDPAAYDSLIQSVHQEHKPETDEEYRLANSVIQHYWLMQRAINLQELILSKGDPDLTDVDSKKLSLFLRYQTTHERSYYRALKELKNRRKENRSEQNGFESQKRQQESHEAKVRLTNARAQNLEIDTACRQVMEAPIPGNAKLSFEELTHACSTAISIAVSQNQMKNAAS